MPFLTGKPGGAAFRLRLVVLVALVVAGGGLAASLVGRARHGEPPTYAVIYARERYLAKTNDFAIDLYRQSLPAGTPRVIYTIAPDNDVPRSAGYRPSPDGRWLWVWHDLNDEHGLPTATRLLLVSVPDGKVVPMAEVKSYPRGGYGRFVFTFAPVWLDAHQLLLEASFGSAVFDVRTRKFTRSLPAWPPKTLPKSTYGYTTLPTPEAFVRRHYPDDLECVKKAVAKLGAELGLRDYLTADYEPDTLESMLALPLGVARPDGHGRAKRALPELACSPNHRYLARAVVLPTETAIQRKDLEGNWRVGHEVAARLDFLDLAGRDQFGGGVQNVLPGAFAQEGKPYRAVVPPEYLLPRFGDLRFSPDGRFFSYTAYDILPPHGIPGIRGATAKVQGRAQPGFPSTGIYIRDSWWATAHPEETDRQPHRYEWLYFIPDAFNAFVVPAAEEVRRR